MHIAIYRPSLHQYLYRALGLVMAKCKTIGGVSYDVYKKLFDSLVSLIIEYAAAIWSYTSYRPY
jgi:hypothetical protein